MPDRVLAGVLDLVHQAIALVNQLVDVQVRNEAGEVPRDDKTSGELVCRGPWVSASYAVLAACDSGS